MLRIKTKRCLFVSFLLVWPGLAVVFASEPVAPESSSAGAHTAIGQFNSVILDIMKRADELGYAGRFETVAPAVRQTFDLHFMAAKSIGSWWRKIDEEQRARWVAAFEGFTISNFADRFDGYSGEGLSIVGEKPASHSTVVVLTRLVRPGKDDVGLDYRMREQDGAWRIIDLYSDGTVSEVALRRSEYGAVLKRGGIEQLISAVNAKTAQRAGK